MARRRFARSAEQVAADLGISETNARRFLVAGMPASGEAEQRAWIARNRERESAGKSARSRELEEIREQARVEQIILQNKKLKFELDRLERRVIPIEESEGELLQLALSVRQAIVKFPVVLTGQIVVVDDPAEFARVQRIIQLACEGVLRQLESGHGEREEEVGGG